MNFFKFHLQLHQAKQTFKLQTKAVDSEIKLVQQQLKTHPNDEKLKKQYNQLLSHRLDFENKYVLAKNKLKYQYHGIDTDLK